MTAPACCREPDHDRSGHGVESVLARLGMRDIRGRPGESRCGVETARLPQRAGGRRRRSRGHRRETPRQRRHRCTVPARDARRGEAPAAMRRPRAQPCRVRLRGQRVGRDEPGDRPARRDRALAPPRRRSRRLARPDPKERDREAAHGAPSAHEDQRSCRSRRSAVVEPALGKMDVVQGAKFLPSAVQRPPTPTGTCWAPATTSASCSSSRDHRGSPAPEIRARPPRVPEARSRTTCASRPTTDIGHDRHGRHSRTRRRARWPFRTRAPRPPFRGGPPRSRP